jgi:hypothetical protein
VDHEADAADLARKDVGGALSIRAELTAARKYDVQILYLNVCSEKGMCREPS